MSVADLWGYKWTITIDNWLLETEDTSPESILWGDSVSAGRKGKVCMLWFPPVFIGRWALTLIY